MAFPRALVLALPIALGCERELEDANYKHESPMKIDCQEIAKNTVLTVELDANSKPGRAFVRFVNKTQWPLWFPAQPEPTYRPEEEAQILRIWFGYSDPVHGKYAGRYMIPPMRLVPQGGETKVELIAPALVEKLLERHLFPEIEVRLATRELPETKTRGEQPLKEYLEHSCVIQTKSGSGRQ